MKIPNPSWYDAILVRRSRRQFDSNPLKGETVQHLKDFIAELNPRLQGSRAVLVNEDPDNVFKGFIGSYGKIKNAPAYVAFIGDLCDPNVQEKTGYLGECVILEATAKGLGTCWVGGFFNQKVVSKQIVLEPGEKVLAVTPVGYPVAEYTIEEKLISGIPGGHKRKSLETLCKGLPEDNWPKWMHNALEAARLAPSAVNRQPWRFNVNESTINLSVNSPGFSLGISKRLDCGIALLHLQVGILHAGEHGKFQFLSSPDVAKVYI